MFGFFYFRLFGVLVFCVGIFGYVDFLIFCFVFCCWIFWIFFWIFWNLRNFLDSPTGLHLASGPPPGLHLASTWPSDSFQFFQFLFIFQHTTQDNYKRRTIVTKGHPPYNWNHLCMFAGGFNHKSTWTLLGSFPLNLKKLNWFL